MLKKPLINNQIRSPKVRVIDDKGEQLGVMDIREALQEALQSNLFLVQVTTKAEPPVCKIMDYGKYLYQLQKKEKAGKKTKVELKSIRVRYNISIHDLETRVKQSEKFLRKGNPVRIEMQLRGREKALQDFAREKMSKFLELLRDKVEIKIEQDIKKQPRGITMIISHNK